MEQSFSSMDENKLIKEYILLSKVQQNLQSLSLYNPQLKSSLINVEADLKQIKGQLFFRYKNHNRIKLESIVLTGSDLQTRMEKYIYGVKNSLLANGYENTEKPPCGQTQWR